MQRIYEQPTLKLCGCRAMKAADSRCTVSDRYWCFRQPDIYRTVSKRTRTTKTPHDYSASLQPVPVYWKDVCFQSRL